MPIHSPKGTLKIRRARKALMSALGQKQTCALQNVMSALQPNSDRESEIPLKAMSALPPKADIRFYSITWSARDSIDCGTERPSALAVLRLITSSYFVGA